MEERNVHILFHLMTSFSFYSAVHPNSMLKTSLEKSKKHVANPASSSQFAKIMCFCFFFFGLAWRFLRPALRRQSSSH